MIQIIEGRGVGAGKSYYVCTQMLVHFLSGGTVFAASTFGLRWQETKQYVAQKYNLLLEDSQFNTFEEDDIPRLHEITPRGTPDAPVLVVVDEAHTKLNARDFGDKTKRPFFNWLTQSRHDDTDVLFISQHAKNMDSQIARLATYIIRVRNMANFSIPGLGKWPFKQFVVNRYDQDGSTLQDRKWLKHDKGIFGIYNTKIMRGAHKRASGEILKLKLQKANKEVNMKPIVVILLIILGLGGYFGFKLYQQGGPNNSKQIIEEAKKAEDAKRAEERRVTGQTPSTAKATGPIPVIQAQPLYDIAAEAFRGTDGRTFLRTDVGTYTVGSMSGKGYVESIKGDIAKVRTPTGRMLFVVAEQRAFGGQTMVVDDKEVPKERQGGSAEDKFGYVAGNVPHAGAQNVTVKVGEQKVVEPESKALQARRLKNFQ